MARFRKKDFFKWTQKIILITYLGTKMQIKIFNIPKAFETDGMYAIRNSGLVASVRSKSLSFHLFLNQSSKHFN